MLNFFVCAKNIWPPWLLVSNWLLILFKILVHDGSLLVALKILFLAFNSLIIMYVSVGLYKFILIRVHWASWMYRLRTFIKFGKFSTIISAIFFCPFLSFPSLTCCTWSHVQSTKENQKNTILPNREYSQRDKKVKIWAR